MPSILGVGYGGLRVISREDGVTWKDDQESDGIHWTHAGPVGDTGGHTYVFFESGLFY